MCDICGLGAVRIGTSVARVEGVRHRSTAKSFPVLNQTMCKHLDALILHNILFIIFGHEFNITSLYRF